MVRPPRNPTAAAVLGLSAALGIHGTSLPAQKTLRDYPDLVELVDKLESLTPAQRREREQRIHTAFVEGLDAFERDSDDDRFWRAAIAGHLCLRLGGPRRFGPESFAQAGAAFVRNGRFHAGDTFCFEVAQWQERVGRLDSAAETYQLIVEGQPTSTRLHARFSLAQIRRLQGRLTAAEELLDRGEALLASLTEGPVERMRAAIAAQRVYLLIDRGLSVEALRALRALEASTSAETDEKTVLHLLDAEIALGRVVPARRRCTAAIERFGDSHGLRTRLAAITSSAVRSGELQGDGRAALRGALQDVVGWRGGAASPLERLTLASLELELRRQLGETDPVRKIAEEVRELGVRLGSVADPWVAYATAMESDALFDRSDARGRQRLLDLLQASFDAMIERWRLVPPRDEPYPFLDYRNRRFLLGELLRAILEVEGDAGHIRALEEVLRFQCLGSIARRGGVGEASLDQVRAALTSDVRGALVYAFGWRRSFAFAVDDGRVIGAQIDLGRDAVRDAARDSVDALLAGDAHADPTRALGAKLVPEALRDRLLHWREVTVVSSQDAGFIPFGELPIGRQDELWHESAALAYLPSLPAGLVLEARATPQEFDHDVLLISAPAAAPELAKRWPETRNSPTSGALHDELVRLLGPERVLERNGLAATLAALASTEARSARMVVVLAHGVTENGPRLVLAPSDAADGLVGGAELRAATQARDGYAPLVMILSCGVARSPTRSGDDGSSQLAGSFLAAGARAVLLAPETLTLGDAREFAAAVAREVRGGATIAAAVCAARQTVGRPCGLLHVCGDGGLRLF